jgi:hypothetical protein
MNDPESNVEMAVRSMLDRATLRIQSTEHEAARQSLAGTHQDPTHRARLRRPGILIAAAACITLVLVGIAIASNPMRSTEQVDTASGRHSSSSSSAPATGAESSTSTPDYYDRAISSIHGPVALPTTRPPGVEWVWLSAGSATNGPPEQDLMVEHGDSGVRVCPQDLCGSAPGELIRTFTADGVTFEVIHVSTRNSADMNDIAPLGREVAAFWESTTFTSQRPAWLLPSMEPGATRTGS